MATQYASQQPAGFKNHVEKVAIVGATGSVGSYFTHELLKTGKHQVTAITRGGADIPKGVAVKKVDYNDQTSLVAALEGQEVLIITMGVMAKDDPQSKLIDAAAKAKVPYVFPNDYGFDKTCMPMAEEAGFLGEKDKAVRKQIEDLGVSSWIGFTCGFWYEFSLVGLKTPSQGDLLRYGFDFPNKTITFFDEGKVSINTSTWLQCGRAMASVLSLKVLPEDANDKSATLSQFKNNFVLVSSFNINQRQMFESVLRVTGDKESDWTVKAENSKERYADGMAMMKSGNPMGFVKLMYTRIFYPNDGGDFEKTKGTSNAVLGLPKEDLDEATKRALDMKAAEAKGGLGSVYHDQMKAQGVS